MFKFNKKKYIAVFLVKEQNSYEIMSTKRFSPTDKVIRFKKESIPIISTLHTFSLGLKLYFCIDTTTNSQLFFQSSKSSTVSAKVVDMILQESIITQLTSNLTNISGITMRLVYIILYIVFGVLIGFIIGQYISFPLPTPTPIPIPNM